MGFFDKVKKKAQAAVGQVPAYQAQEPAAPAPQQYAQAPAPQQYAQEAAAPAGPVFQWNGENYPMPTGWDGLSADDWFYKFETLRDRLMHIDDEQGLPHMTDEDGDPLDSEEVLLVTAFGFQSGGDYEAYRNWAVSGFAQQTGESPTDCEFRLGGIAREKIMAAKAGAMTGAGGALAPVEGVSCEAWAQIQAQIAGGADAYALIAAAGIDQPRWDRVSAEWIARMSADTTMAITTVYSNAFAGGGVGQYGGAAAQAASAGIGGDVGAEPVSFEVFVEVQEAQSAAAERGEDAIAVLASFGMQPVDWSNIGMYWNKRMAQEATKYHQLYSEYSAKYAAKYGTGDGLTQDQREEKVLAQILHMAGTGQAGQVLAYLKDYFPDDAGDDLALDWWFEKACEMCGESGDRARAQQLVPLRYPLQEDEEDPMEEWVASEMESLFS